MEMKVESLGDVSLVTVAVKYLDASNCDEFMHDVQKLVEANPKLVLDLSNLDVIDSSGIGALAFCLRKTREAGGGLKLCCVTEPVQMAFRLIHLERNIATFDTRQEAVKAFEPSKGE